MVLGATARLQALVAAIELLTPTTGGVPKNSPGASASDLVSIGHPRAAIERHECAEAYAGRAEHSRRAARSVGDVGNPTLIRHYLPCSHFRSTSAGTLKHLQLAQAPLVSHVSRACAPGSPPGCCCSCSAHRCCAGVQLWRRCRLQPGVSSRAPLLLTALPLTAPAHDSRLALPPSPLQDRSTPHTMSVCAATTSGSALRLPQRQSVQQRQPRRAVLVRATAQPEPKQPGGGSGLAQMAKSAERMLARYDFLSAGLGALCVTGFCVARGQDVGTALWITAAATVGEEGRREHV